MIYTKRCEYCGKEFTSKIKRAVTCSQFCRTKLQIRKEREIRFKKLLEGIEGKDYVIDLWTGNPTPSIVGSYINKFHPDKTIEDYKLDFPNAQLMCSKYLKNISKNSGKFMRLPEYKKKYSEMFKGDKNPNSKLNATIEERQSRSPFSKKFYEHRNLPLSDRNTFIKNIIKSKSPSSWNTKIEYYINKGLTNEEAKLALSKRQHTYKGGKYSKICMNMINDVLNENKSLDKFLFGKNELILKDNISNKHYMFDLTNKVTKHIIEFNGDFWHGNYKLFKPNDFNPILNKTYEEIHTYDLEKYKYAEKCGYKILVIWEYDYINNKEMTLSKIKKFIL